MSWNKIDCIAGETSFGLKEYRNHFVLIPFHRLKWIAVASVTYFGLKE